MAGNTDTDFKRMRGIKTDLVKFLAQSVSYVPDIGRSAILYQHQELIIGIAGGDISAAQV